METKFLHFSVLSGFPGLGGVVLKLLHLGDRQGADPRPPHFLVPSRPLCSSLAVLLLTALQLPHYATLSLRQVSPFLAWQALSDSSGGSKSDTIDPFSHSIRKYLPCAYYVPDTDLEPITNNYLVILYFNILPHFLTLIKAQLSCLIYVSVHCLIISALEGRVYHDFP